MHIPVLPTACSDNSIEQKQVDSAMEECIGLHRSLVVPLVLNLTTAWIQHGELIIRPMWYSVQRNTNPTEAAPTEDKKIFGINDQFMLGPSVIVVPAINWKSPRSVRLLEGKWRQMVPVEKIHAGPITIQIEDVPLTGPPVYFVRVEEN